MNRKLLAALVSGAMVLPMASSAQDADADADVMEVPDHPHSGVVEHEHDLGEGDEMMMVPMHGHQYQLHPAAAHGHDELHGHSSTVYGSFRYGIQAEDSGDDLSWTVGSAHGGRFGIRGTTDAGEGLTAGFHVERNLNDTLSARHHNVSLSGPFGTAALGQQGSPYYSAVTWDGSNQLGGYTDFGLRVPGVSFTSSLGGPFTFSALVGNGAATGADHIETTGSLSAGPVNLNVAFMRQVDDGERVGGSVGGAMAGIDWEVGYETATDITCTAATAASTADDHTAGTTMHAVTAAGPAVICDQDRYGFHVGYTHGAGPGGGTAFVQYGNVDSDVAANELDYWVFGYSYYVSTAVTVQAAHRVLEDEDAMTADSTSVLVLKVDF